MRSWEGGEGRARASAGVDEEMEEVEEREEDTISNVRMDAAQGTFIAGHGRRYGWRSSGCLEEKNAVMVKDDI